jgi:hypothetical protein
MQASHRLGQQILHASFSFLQQGEHLRIQYKSSKMLTNANNAIAILSAISGLISIIGIIMNFAKYRNSHAKMILKDWADNPHMRKQDSACLLLL